MKKPSILRKLYNWVLGWADKPHSEIFLFLLAFSESSWFPVPPGVILIPLVLGNRQKWIRYAVITLIASVLGGIFGYFIGWKLWWGGTEYLPDFTRGAGVNQFRMVPGFTAVAHFFFDVIPGFTKELFWVIREKYQLYNFWIVFTAGFSPIPYKVITISAGAFNIDFLVFIIASVISRGARFFLVTGITRIFGERARRFIDKYLNFLALLLVVLLVIGFFLIKYIF